MLRAAMIPAKRSAVSAIGEGTIRLSFILASSERVKTRAPSLCIRSYTTAYYTPHALYVNAVSGTLTPRGPIQNRCCAGDLHAIEYAHDKRALSQVRTNRP